MLHAYIDALARRPGLAGSLDPRGKILLALATILAVVATSDAWRLGVLAGGLVVVVALLHLPVLYLLRRVLLVLPFAGMVAGLVPFTRPGAVVWAAGPLELTHEGLVQAGLLLARSLLAALVALLLVSTTPFSRLLAGLRRLGMPRLLVLVLAFLYRYLSLLADEAMRVRRAALSRGFGPRSPQRLAVGGAMLGSLFLRTYDRAERVYLAMAARGFAGEVPLLDPLRLRPADVAVTAAGLAGLGVVAWLP